MREVFSAVVVIGLVLVAVFVPVAFFPGTTGRLYQQFSLTIAFAVVLSVFNAVTFTPALSALLLDRAAARPRPVLHAASTGSSTAAPAPTCGVLRFSLAHRFVLALLFVGLARATWLVFRAVPSSFVPGRGRGLLHHHRPGAGRRVARVHDAGSPSRPSRSW